MAYYRGQRIYDGEVSIGYVDERYVNEELERCGLEPIDMTWVVKSNDLRFTVFLGERVVGGIELHDIEMDTHEAMIGYRIYDEKNRNKGIGTRALSLVKQYAISEMKIESLVVITDIENYGSRRICEKCGFSYVGTAREGEHLVVYEFKATSR